MESLRRSDAVSRVASTAGPHVDKHARAAAVPPLSYQPPQPSLSNASLRQLQGPEEAELRSMIHALHLRSQQQQQQWHHQPQLQQPSRGMAGLRRGEASATLAGEGKRGAMDETDGHTMRHGTPQVMKEMPRPTAASLAMPSGGHGTPAGTTRVTHPRSVVQAGASAASGREVGPKSASGAGLFTASWPTSHSATPLPLPSPPPPTTASGVVANPGVAPTLMDALDTIIAERFRHEWEISGKHIISVHNLDARTTEPQLLALCQPMGGVSATMLGDLLPQRLVRSGAVLFHDQQGAEAAVRLLDGLSLNGPQQHQVLSARYCAPRDALCANGVAEVAPRGGLNAPAGAGDGLGSSLNHEAPSAPSNHTATTIRSSSVVVGELGHRPSYEPPQAKGGGGVVMESAGGMSTVDRLGVPSGRMTNTDQLEAWLEVVEAAMVADCTDPKVHLLGVHNLEPTTTDQQLYQIFFPMGALKAFMHHRGNLVTTVFITGRMRRSGVVHFSSADMACMAAKKMDSFVPHGQTRPLMVRYLPRSMDPESCDTSDSASGVDRQASPFHRPPAQGRSTDLDAALVPPHAAMLLLPSPSAPSAHATPWVDSRGTAPVHRDPWGATPVAEATPSGLSQRRPVAAAAAADDGAAPRSEWDDTANTTQSIDMLCALITDHLHSPSVHPDHLAELMYRVLAHPAATPRDSRQLATILVQAITSATRHALQLATPLSGALLTLQASLAHAAQNHATGRVAHSGSGGDGPRRPEAKTASTPKKKKRPSDPSELPAVRPLHSADDSSDLGQCDGATTVPLAIIAKLQAPKTEVVVSYKDAIARAVLLLLSDSTAAKDARNVAAVLCGYMFELAYLQGTPYGLAVRLMEKHTAQLRATREYLQKDMHMTTSAEEEDAHEPWIALMECLLAMITRWKERNPAKARCDPHAARYHQLAEEFHCSDAQGLGLRGQRRTAPFTPSSRPTPGRVISKTSPSSCSSGSRPSANHLTATTCSSSSTTNSPNSRQAGGGGSGTTTTNAPTIRLSPNESDNGRLMDVSTDRTYSIPSTVTTASHGSTCLRYAGGGGGGGSHPSRSLTPSSVHPAAARTTLTTISALPLRAAGGRFDSVKCLEADEDLRLTTVTTSTPLGTLIHDGASPKPVYENVLVHEVMLCTVYITKLPGQLHPRQIRRLLWHFGDINKVRVCRDKAQPSIRPATGGAGVGVAPAHSDRLCFGFVEFTTAQAAKSIIDYLRNAAYQPDAFSFLRDTVDSHGNHLDSASAFAEEEIEALGNTRASNARMPIHDTSELDAVFEPIPNDPLHRSIRVRVCLYGLGDSGGSVANVPHGTSVRKGNLVPSARPMCVPPSMSNPWDTLQDDADSDDTATARQSPDWQQQLPQKRQCPPRIQKMAAGVPVGLPHPRSLSPLRTGAAVGGDVAPRDSSSHARRDEAQVLSTAVDHPLFQAGAVGEGTTGLLSTPLATRRGPIADSHRPPHHHGSTDRHAVRTCGSNERDESDDDDVMADMSKFTRSLLSEMQKEPQPLNGMRIGCDSGMRYYVHDSYDAPALPHIARSGELELPPNRSDVAMPHVGEAGPFADGPGVASSVLFDLGCTRGGVAEASEAENDYFRCFGTDHGHFPLYGEEVEADGDAGPVASGRMTMAHTPHRTTLGATRAAESDHNGGVLQAVDTWDPSHLLSMLAAAAAVGPREEEDRQ